MRLVSAKNNPPPSATQINKAMEVAAMSYGGAEYLFKRIKEYCPKSTELIEVCASLVDMCARKQSHVNPWMGAETSSDSVNFHRFMATEAAEKLGTMEAMHLNFSVEEDGRFLRAWTSSEGALSDDEINKLDTLWNAWLAEDHQASSTEGYVFVDNVRLDKTAVKALMSPGGFERYVERYAGISLMTHSHESVSSEQAAALQQAVKDTLLKVEQAEEKVLKSLS